MRAVICTGYGSPDVLELREVDRPAPKDNEVLIKVRATTCHIGDVRVRSFDVPFWQKIPFRLFLGIRRPKRSILGMELAGDVAAIGQHVKRFKEGHAVFATSGFQFGAHAEYICLPEDAQDVKMGLVAMKPTNMSYEEAAAGAATGGITALEVLRRARLQGGEEVLIYGASGSVGVFAVQLAKHFGAKVTGVCSTANVETVRSIGADEVIDYTTTEVDALGKRYDLVVDAVDKLPRAKAKRCLNKTGRLLNVIRDSGAGGAIGTKDLLFLKDLIEKGELRTVIDRRYPLEELAEAHRYVERGHKKGHVVITVAPGP